jgi:hypothetical protein
VKLNVSKFLVTRRRLVFTNTNQLFVKLLKIQMLLKMHPNAQIIA